MPTALRRHVSLAALAASTFLITGAYGQTPTKLTLDEAIQRGLKTNLGVLERETGDRLARIDRVRALSALLPTASAAVTENVQEVNLAVYGFRFPGVPTIIGPYAYADIRASASVDLWNRQARKNIAASEQDIKAAQLSVQEARDLVVAAVANAYLTIVASEARVEAARVDVETAQALYERARDQHSAGVTPAIDELRAQVEWKTRQQQSLAAKNQLGKDKLNLARAIGWPSEQDFEIADAAPYAPLEGLTAPQLLDKAHQSRADYQSLKARIQAAEISKDAAASERYPKVSVNGNYGANGVNVAQLHGTFAVSGSVSVNLFDGGRIRASVDQADATIKQRKDELADLDRQIDTDIRTALLDLNSAADQVAVARDNVDLADKTLAQARDRFAAGVTDNIEVVQAQDALSRAREASVASLYAHNLAKVALARAVGATEASLKQYMGTGSAR